MATAGDRLQLDGAPERRGTFDGTALRGASRPGEGPQLTIEAASCSLTPVPMNVSGQELRGCCSLRACTRTATTRCPVRRPAPRSRFGFTTRVQASARQWRPVALLAAFWMRMLMFFGPGSRIGEAAIPGPVEIRLELLLQDEPDQMRRSHRVGACDEPELLATCACWRDAISRRRRASQLGIDGLEREARVAVSELEEKAAYERARRSIISYAQRVRRPKPAISSGSGDCIDDDSGSSEDADAALCTQELKSAVNELDKAVRAAFRQGRTPLATDVEGITSKLQVVADAVIAGRLANGFQGKCSHQLGAFTTSRAGYTCDDCRGWQSCGVTMFGCRECNFDLCHGCWSARSVKPPSLQQPASSASHRVHSVQSGPAVEAQPPSVHQEHHVATTATSSRRRHRRRGSGSSRKKRFLGIYYGNITSMSKKAEHYLLSLPDDIWLAAETHIRQEDIEWRCRGWSRKWEITAVPAAPSTESHSGSYGGVVAAARRHLSTSTIAGDVPKSGWCLSCITDLAGRTVHLEGVDVLIFGGYARHGDYSQLAAAVARATRNGQLPFVWLADFNASPSELEEAEWLGRLDAHVIRPDASITCHQGRGSIIDFGICSRCLLPYVGQFQTVLEVPWKPHDGLRLTLRRSPRAVMVRTFVRPRPLKDASAVADGGAPLELDWQDALALARKNAHQGTARWSKTAQAQRRAAEAMGIADISEQLSVDLAAWAHATELQALARAGVASGETAFPFLGRSRMPRFRQQPLMRCPRLVAEALRLPGGYGIAARLWATCRALAAKLCTAVQRNANCSEICLVKERIIQLILRDSGDLRGAWAAVKEGADVAAGLFAILAVCNPSAAVSSVDAAVATFERLESIEAQRGRESADAAWNRWVGEAIAGGARLAHRWANRPNATVADVAAPGARGPLDVARHHTNVWAEHWKAGDSRRVEEAFEAVKALRGRALAHPTHGALLGHLVPRNVRAAAKMFRRGTSIGADAVALQDIIEASDESLEELCRIMRCAVRDLAMPTTALLVLVSLLGKKLGGSRCIAVCTTFYRVLIAVMKGEVREWDVEVGMEGDSALPGRSPLDETAWRHLLMEQAVLLGKHVAQLLWDVAKFFDSLNIPLLIERAEELNFPIDQLVLGMQAHRAPRVLRVDGCCAEAIPATGVSVLAGCSLSTSLSRAFVQGPIAGGKVGLHSDDAQCRTHQHVDDVNQVVIGNTEKSVVARCRREGLRISTAFVKSGLSISVKSVAVASSKRLADLVVAALGRAGQPINAVAAAEDLGIPTGCGARRVIGAFKKRLARGLCRSRRVQNLVRVNPKAAKLYQTGVYPQQSYGAVAHGAAPEQVRSMRRAAVLSVAPAGAQPCTTTIIVWRLGSHRDPAVAAPLEQVKLWMRMWARAPAAQRKELEMAWMRALPRVLLGGVHWSRVTGPLQATIAVLGQLGWHPVAPDRWISIDGSEYAELDWSPYANVGILQALAAGLEAAAWRSAARHFLGQGLETGAPSIAPARAARRWLLKQERWKEVKALDCVVCGGVWAAFRTGAPAACDQCGEHNVTAYHRYWSCPRLQEHPDEAVRKTQWMTKLFHERHAGLQCLWGRGLLPACLVNESAQLNVDSIEPIATPGFDGLVAKLGKAYTDGSGGDRWIPQASKRAGSAAVTLRVHTVRGEIYVENVGLLIAPVPGKPTVPRAELWAAILAARSAPQGGSVALQIDAAYVVKGMAPNRQASLCAGANGDLWCLLIATIQQRSLSVTATKVKAHAESQVLVGTVEMEDFLGNALADAGAGAAAEVAVNTVEAQEASLWQERAFLVARRLAIIEASLWQEGPRLVPAPPALERLEPPTIPVAVSAFEAAICRMGHKLHNRGTHLYCSLCRRRRRIAGHKYWTSTPCTRPDAHLRQFVDRDEGSVPASKAPRPAPAEQPVQHGDDEDPFGYAHLGLDDDAAGPPIAFAAADARRTLSQASAELDAADVCKPQSHVAGAATPGTACQIRSSTARPGSSQAALRLESLRLRVRAREQRTASVIESKGASERAALTNGIRQSERPTALSRRTHFRCDRHGVEHLVTPAKRRRLMSTQRAMQREDVAAASVANAAAWRQLARCLPRVPEPEPEVHDVLPFNVDSSHEGIICGGYVGCIRCGSVVATQAQSALNTRCRGDCPPGACGPVRRLAAGRRPRGDTWPSGEDEPLPKRLR